MSQGIRESYDFEKWQQRPIDGAFVFTIGFLPWLQDLQGRAILRRKQKTEGATRWARSVLGAEEKSVSPVIDIYEHRSSPQARETLLNMLENNMLAKLPQVPDQLGDVAFQHPAEAPAGVFFARGNLVVSVTGDDAALALKLAQALDTRIVSREGLVAFETRELEEDEADLSSLFAKTRTDGQRVTEEGYVKVFTTGGELRFAKDGKAWLRRMVDVVAKIEIYTAEPPGAQLPVWPAAPSP